MEFVEGLRGEDVIVKEIDTEILESFLWGVHRGLIKGVSFDPNPDDVELTTFSSEYHSRRISSPNRMTTSTAQGVVGLSGTTNIGPSSLGLGGNSNLELLTSALTRAIEDQGGVC